jgi:hypothetical protein
VFGNETQDFAHAHSAGVHRHAPFVETVQAPLVPGDQGEFEASLAFARNLNPQRTPLGETRHAGHATTPVLLGERPAINRPATKRQVPLRSVRPRDYGIVERQHQVAHLLARHRTFDQFADQLTWPFKQRSAGPSSLRHNLPNAGHIRVLSVSWHAARRTL